MEPSPLLEAAVTKEFGVFRPVRRLVNTEPYCRLPLPVPTRHYVTMRAVDDREDVREPDRMKDVTMGARGHSF